MLSLRNPLSGRWCRGDGRSSDGESVGRVNWLVVIVIGGGLDNGSRTYLEALTSAPCPTSSLTTRSFPPDDAAYNEYTIENGIDRLAVGESIFDKTSVTVCCC